MISAAWRLRPFRTDFIPGSVQLRFLDKITKHLSGGSGTADIESEKRIGRAELDGHVAPALNPVLKASEVDDGRIQR